MRGITFDIRNKDLVPTTALFFHSDSGRFRPWLPCWSFLRCILNDFDLFHQSRHRLVRSHTLERLCGYKVKPSVKKDNCEEISKVQGWHLGVSEGRSTSRYGYCRFHNLLGRDIW